MRSALVATASAGRLPGTVAKAVPARLQLTSLVDMMVILVVFLLKSFAVEGQLVSPAAGLVLPESSSRTPVSAGLVVEVGPRQVRVGGQYVMSTPALVAADSPAVVPLTAALETSFIAHGDAPVLVQADHQVDYRHLSQVLRACSAAGWQDVTLVVLEVTE